MRLGKTSEILEVTHTLYMAPLEKISSKKLFKHIRVFEIPHKQPLSDTVSEFIHWNSYAHFSQIINVGASP